MDPCVAAAAFALDKLLAKEPKWPDRILTAMVREIIPPLHTNHQGNLPRTVRQQWEAKVKEGMLQLKGVHASTTMALFQRVAMMMCEKERGAMNRAIHDIGK